MQARWFIDPTSVIRLSFVPCLWTYQNNTQWDNSSPISSDTYMQKIIYFINVKNPTLLNINIWRIVRLFLTFCIFSCLSRIWRWANTWLWVILSICGQGKIAGTVIYSDLTAIGTGKRFLNDPLVILRQCVQRIGIDRISLYKWTSRPVDALVENLDKHDGV